VRVGHAMRMQRRKFLGLTVGAAALPVVSQVATAQTYPTRPITMIVPFPPGGTADVVARLVAEGMRRHLGQSIIIENVGGADGNIGVGRAARAKPDGYTLCVGVLDTHVLNGAFYSLPYDVLRDFTPITPLVANPIVLFGQNAIPAKDLSGLVTWLKMHPNQASAGVNSLSFRLIAQFFQKQTGTQFTIVPYRAANSLREDFIAGRINLLVGLPVGITLFPEVSTTAYAVTADTRLASAPAIPTFAEAGLPSLVYSFWYGLFAPKGMPDDIIAKVNAATVGALADPIIHKRLNDDGFDVFPREKQNPASLAAMQNADAGKWWPIIKELGMKAQ
jgi:tripartite-type tricarboxylate transporter receptor subunit TctC